MKCDIDMNKLSLEQVKMLLELKKEGVLEESGAEEKKENIGQKEPEKKEELPTIKKRLKYTDDYIIQKAKEIIRQENGATASRIANKVMGSGQAYYRGKIDNLLKNSKEFAAIEKSDGTFAYVDIIPFKKKWEDNLPEKIKSVLTEPMTSCSVARKILSYNPNFKQQERIEKTLLSMDNISTFKKGERTLYALEGMEAKPQKRDTEGKYLQQRKRMKFVWDRAFALMRQNPSLTLQEARVRAFQEIRTNAKPTQKVEEQTTIIFPSVGKDFQQVALQTVRNAHQYKMSITYDNSSYGLGIESPEQWEAFLVDVMKNSFLISKALGIENKFKTEGEGLRKVLRYG